jgi:hypothetical protein
MESPDDEFEEFGINTDVPLVIRALACDERIGSKVAKTPMGQMRLFWSRQFNAYPMIAWSLGADLRLNGILRCVAYADVFSIFQGAHPPTPTQFASLFADNDDPDDETARVARILGAANMVPKALKDDTPLLAIHGIGFAEALLEDERRIFLRDFARVAKRRFRRMRRAAIIVTPPALFDFLYPHGMPPEDQLTLRSQIERLVRFYRTVELGKILDGSNGDDDILLLDEPIGD